MSLPNPPMATRDAVAHYWRQLLGVVLFPPVALTTSHFVALPQDLASFLLAILFFASIAPVVWLLVTRRVRYSFWLAAIGIYFAAGLAASFVYQVLRALAS